MHIRDTLALAAILSAGLFAASPVHPAVSHARAQATHPTVKAVEVHDKYAFAPKKKTVKVGTMVVWKNTTDAGHTVTGKKGWKFNKKVAEDKSVSFKFTKAGTYHYYCVYHPWMVGTITVQK